MADDTKDTDGRRERIRALNDRLRTTGTGGRLLVTAGIQAQGSDFVLRVAEAVCQFEAFGPDNDPHGEHDFGNLTVDGQTIYFKIDYYDPTFSYASEDPTDSEKTVRVLTILLTEEY